MISTSKSPRPITSRYINVAEGLGYKNHLNDEVSKRLLHHYDRTFHYMNHINYPAYCIDLLFYKSHYSTEWLNHLVLIFRIGPLIYKVHH